MSFSQPTSEEIRGIKEVRAETGLGLREARDLFFKHNGDVSGAIKSVKSNYQPEYKSDLVIQGYWVQGCHVLMAYEGFNLELSPREIVDIKADGGVVRALVYKDEADRKIADVMRAA
ncbi:hypothetical protein [Burkholderia phage BCSR5]|nr:hypothetical protein [Burkholderia phage BCSR5]